MLWLLLFAGVGYKVGSMEAPDVIVQISIDVISIKDSWVYRQGVG